MATASRGRVEGVAPPYDGIAQAKSVHVAHDFQSLLMRTRTLAARNKLALGQLGRFPRSY